MILLFFASVPPLLMKTSLHVFLSVLGLAWFEFRLTKIPIFHGVVIRMDAPLVGNVSVLTRS
jgi:hypothetical protein